MDIHTLYILLACLFGLMMTWGVGANDLANVMSTAMGSKAITIRQAIIIAMIFETAGAFLGGNEVSQTLRLQIINLDVIAQNHSYAILIDGMLAVLVAGMTWMGLASYLGFPVSITNAIVGSIVGFGMVVIGVHGVHWHEVSSIAASWVISPTVSGVAAYILFNSIQSLILSRPNPLQQAKRFMPIYFFLVGLVLSYITVFKTLQHFKIDLHPGHDTLLASVFGLVTAFIGWLATKRLYAETVTKRRQAFHQVEAMFAVLMAFTACAMVFAHGANDVSVAVGPLTIVVGLATHGKLSMLEGASPPWITLLGCSGVLFGLMTYGWKVIETVGSGITDLTPSRAFAATISAAGAVVISNSIGLPVSTTQTLVGAVLGVGLARGIGALNLIVIRNIFMSWVVTLPVASGLTILFFRFFEWVL